jgi:broad specificity polyphosphatase/5'/3'-nucleotidase SurE
MKKAEKNKVKKMTITITGDRDMAEQFMWYFDGQGEQDYWNWQDSGEEGTTVTATRFKYDFDKLEIIGTDDGR